MEAYRENALGRTVNHRRTHLYMPEPMTIFWNLLCTSIALIFTMETQAAQPTRLKVIYSTISPPTAPLWIAKEKGFFEKYGLSVDLVFIESGPRSVQALLSGDAVIATSAGPAVANAKLSGADVVMIAGLINVFPFFSRNALRHRFSRSS